MISEPRQYLIVPRTTGCGLKRPEYAEPEQIKLMDSQGTLHPLFVSTIADIFNKFDLEGANFIELKEFRGLLEVIGKGANGGIRDENEWRNGYLGKFNHYENGITLRGFKEWWRAQLIAEGDAAIW